MNDDEKRSKPPGVRTLKEGDITAAPVTDRRRMIFGMAVGLVGTAALTGCVVQPAGGGGGPRPAGRTDNDPNDAPGRGTQTGRSDNDPNDGVGRGSGRSGRTDNDPNDGVGRGSATGRSDTDPNDRPGRGGRVRDNDPGDP
jgi:hypothetical protein